MRFEIFQRFELDTNMYIYARHSMLRNRSVRLLQYPCCLWTYNTTPLIYNEITHCPAESHSTGNLIFNRE